MKACDADENPLFGNVELSLFQNMGILDSQVDSLFPTQPNHKVAGMEHASVQLS